ncbi:sensor histidine kinase [Rhizobium sp. SSA_523]|uniref:sensor histidine kinase n=1 Tax=Rhizobium sp. SSA_523 TaxID=2952477 RepID=UPI00209088C2|nr:ATP-binding protein [Rhizobium sp. SSA_523]MCO5734213.1 ATP-binding protein [Rhizobium sp. SSA_523]WKC21508.1 ATP-binding protein [Rhizobium sp. SSA_523]
MQPLIVFGEDPDETLLRTGTWKPVAEGADWVLYDIALPRKSRHLKALVMPSDASLASRFAEEAASQTGSSRPGGSPGAAGQPLTRASGQENCLADGAMSPARRDTDVETALDIALTLTEDIHLDRLIETLMTKMLDHSGASSGCLYRICDGRLHLEARALRDTNRILVSMAGDEWQAAEPSRALIRAALQSRTPFIATRSELGFAAAAEKSAAARGDFLCVPLLRRGDLTGLLCLQNDRRDGAFATDALALVKLLASQAAISLENARLHARLVQENDLRARSEAALASARGELERSARLTILGGIAASVTHEIAQPLAAIASNAGASLRWLQRAQPDLEEAVSSLSAISASVDRAHDIIRALRALAKQAPGDERPVCLDDLIADVIRIAGAEVERQGVELLCELAARPAKICGDATQLKQVVLNLLTNAMEAVEALPRERRRVILSSSLCQDTIVVAVRDFGTGIAPASAERLFEPMYTTKASGMGMGLSICRSIIETHGGHLKALPQEPGSLFSFELPILRPTARQDRPA